jgi:DNA polymerase III delta prime subunit
MQQNVLWVEYYRPKTLSDIILPASYKEKFENGLESNLLLSGTHGVGKTTLAKILAFGHSVKFINASLNNGIDTVRSEIQDFVGTGSLINPNKKKVVILDECDNFTEAGQKSLRGFIEQYHKNALFILTANYPERIIEPLRSRLTEIVFNFNDEESKEQLLAYIDRIKMILKHNKLTIADDALRHLLKTRYPDLRKIIGDLQIAATSLKDTNAIELKHVSALRQSKYDELYQFLLSLPSTEKTYGFIKSKYLNKETDAMNALSSDFLKYLSDHDKINKVISVATISHKYNYEMPQSTDKFVTLLACCGALIDILKTK